MGGTSNRSNIIMERDWKVVSRLFPSSILRTLDVECPGKGKNEFSAILQQHIQPFKQMHLKLGIQLWEMNLDVFREEKEKNEATSRSEDYCGCASIFNKEEDANILAELIFFC